MNLNILIKKLNNDLNENYSKHISQLTDLEYIELKDAINNSLYEEKVLLNKETINLIDSRHYSYIIQLLPCIKKQYSDKYLTKLVLAIINNVKAKYSTYQYNKFMYDLTVFLNIYDLINTEYLSKKEQEMFRELYPFYPEINNSNEIIEELLFYNDIQMSNAMIMCCAFLSGNQTLFDKYITRNDNELIRILCSSEKMQKQPLFNYARSLVQQILNHEENQIQLSSADIASIKSTNFLNIKDNKYENIKIRSEYHIAINSKTAEVIKDMVFNSPFDSIIDCFDEKHLRLIAFKNQDDTDSFLLHLMSRQELIDTRYLKLLSKPIHQQLTNYLFLIMANSNDRTLLVKSVRYFLLNVYKKNDNFEIKEINLEI